MMSEFFGSFLTPSLPPVRILLTDPLLVKSEFHGSPPSHLIRTLFMDVPYSFLRVNSGATKKDPCERLTSQPQNFMF